MTFDLPELCRVAAKAVDRNSDDIDNVLKVAEGGSYRIFELTFGDGFHVIARLPYPSTRPITLGVASEVATMAFLRLHGCPIPSVYDWSSSTSNPVGAEYMIMEKVQGIELQSICYSMDVQQRMNVVGKIVDLEKTLFSIPLPANGSIYFKDTEAIQVAEKVGIVSDMTEDKFCIGPSTEYLWWYQGREKLRVNRGACRNGPSRRLFQD